MAKVVTIPFFLSFFQLYLIPQYCHKTYIKGRNKNLWHKLGAAGRAYVLLLVTFLVIA